MGTLTSGILAIDAVDIGVSAFGGTRELCPLDMTRFPVSTTAGTLSASLEVLVIEEDLPVGALEPDWLRNNAGAPFYQPMPCSE